MHLDYFLTLNKDNKIKVSSIPFDNLTLKVKKLSLLNVGKTLRIFQIIKCIGSGGFSKVFLARAYGILMAIKVMQKQTILQTGKQSIIQNQKYILQTCHDHPFVTKLYLSIETDKYIIFGMEYCNGGQLFNLLRKVKRMTEQQAKFYFLETLSVISYLHSKKIVYRDLKPENIIIDHEGHIRLADYGLSKILTQEKQKTYSFCGSAQYMAPQMLMKKGHSYEVDYYCLGALMYELVTGLPPYYSRDQNELFYNILEKDLSFPEDYAYGPNSYSNGIRISPQLKQFLSKLLQKNTQNRFKNIQQMFSYKWFKDVNLDIVLNRSLKPPFSTQNFSYNFDDQQFADDQQRQMRRLQIEKDNGQVKNSMFQGFGYQSLQIKNIKKVIIDNQQKSKYKKRFSQDQLVEQQQQQQYQEDFNYNNRMIESQKELPSQHNKKGSYKQYMIKGFKKVYQSNVPSQTPSSSRKYQDINNNINYHNNGNPLHSSSTNYMNKKFQINQNNQQFQFLKSNKNNMNKNSLNDKKSFNNQEEMIIPISYNVVEKDSLSSFQNFKNKNQMNDSNLNGNNSNNIKSALNLKTSLQQFHHLSPNGQTNYYSPKEYQYQYQYHSQYPYQNKNQYILPSSSSSSFNQNASTKYLKNSYGFSNHGGRLSHQDFKTIGINNPSQNNTIFHNFGQISSAHTLTPSNSSKNSLGNTHNIIQNVPHSTSHLNSIQRASEKQKGKFKFFASKKFSHPSNTSINSNLNISNNQKNIQKNSNENMKTSLSSLSFLKKKIQIEIQPQAQLQLTKGKEKQIEIIHNSLNKNPKKYQQQNLQLSSENNQKKQLNSPKDLNNKRFSTQNNNKSNLFSHQSLKTEGLKKFNPSQSFSNKVRNLKFNSNNQEQKEHRSSQKNILKKSLSQNYQFIHKHNIKYQLPAPIASNLNKRFHIVNRNVYQKNNNGGSQIYKMNKSLEGQKKVGLYGISNPKDRNNQSPHQISIKNFPKNVNSSINYGFNCNISPKSSNDHHFHQHNQQHYNYNIYNKNYYCNTSKK